MKVHYGKSATLFYRWDDRAKHFGGRISSVMAKVNRHKDDPRFEVRFISINGKRYQPDDIEVHRDSR
jgi:hypothetical protein